MPVKAAGKEENTMKFKRPARRRTVVEDSVSSSEDEEIDDHDPDAHLKYSILGEAKRERYKRVFESIDVNGDGTLDINELESALEITPHKVHSDISIETTSPVVNLPDQVVLAPSGNGQQYSDDYILHYRDI